MKIREMPDMKFIPITDEPQSWLNSVYDWLFTSRRILITSDWYFTIPGNPELKRPEIRIKIPCGFIFDGASVPRFLWPVVDPMGILFINGLLHDFGYRYNFLLDGNGKPIFVDAGRKFFDLIFYDVGLYTNGTYALNKMAYYALRMFGWAAWNKNRDDNSPIYWIQDGRSVKEMWSDMLETIVPETYLHSGCPREIFLNGTYIAEA